MKLECTGMICNWVVDFWSCSLKWFLTLAGVSINNQRFLLNANKKIPSLGFVASRTENWLLSCLLHNYYL